MYCSNCGNRLIDNEKFCQNCGNNVQITNKQNDIQNLVENISENCQNNLTKKHQKLSRIFSYKTIYEKLLAVLNSILFGFIIYYFIISFGLFFAFITIDILLMFFIVLFGGEPFMFTNQVLTNSAKDITVFGILFLILIVVNGVMCYLMYKKNKNSNTGFKVKKFKYLFITCLFGFFGANRFMIKDNQGGRFRLIITVISMLLSSRRDIKVITYLSFLLIGCSFGLQTTDFIIALSKKSDNEKNIYV